MRIKRISQFCKFFLIWYSQQFAIPFWIVGHVHLHLYDYHAIIELAASMCMHLAVFAGFYLDWKQHDENQNR